jgi:hypothetical protein
MEVKDWITLAAAVILAIGWIVTGYLNKVKEVAQKRVEYRLKTLGAFLPAWLSIQKMELHLHSPDFLHNLRMPEANVALGKLVPLVRTRILEELKINA